MQAVNILTLVLAIVGSRDLERRGPFPVRPRRRVVPRPASRFIPHRLCPGRGRWALPAHSADERRVWSHGPCAGRVSQPSLTDADARLPAGRRRRRRLPGGQPELALALRWRGLGQDGEIELLVSLGGIARLDDGWPGYLATTVSEFVLSTADPPGVVYGEAAAWLVTAFSGVRSKTAAAIVHAVVNDAQHIDETLLAFVKGGAKRPTLAVSPPLPPAFL